MSFEAIIIPRRGNQVVKRKDSFVMAFEEGDSIGEALSDSLRWASHEAVLYDFVGREYSATWKGPWPGEKAQYLGLKLVKEGQTYYGWAHVRVDTSMVHGPVSVCALGYNRHPDQPIRAGNES